MDTFTDANWEREVLRSPMPVVVGFWAEWCVPCQMAAPALETAERQHVGPLRFGLVNYDENPGLVERYTVKGLPTVMVMKDGPAVERRVGLMGRAALQDLLRKHVAR
ncbi:MAG TPA: thioredoxin domain-containing protein [Vicinamibacteria bacterium]|nr:thioredoxin domain-containing protein [Vicinamibacteria bacterium]